MSRRDHLEVPLRGRPGWEPVFRKEARQNKGLGSIRDSIKIGQTLEPAFLRFDRRSQLFGRDHGVGEGLFACIVAQHAERVHIDFEHAFFFLAH